MLSLHLRFLKLTFLTSFFMMSGYTEDRFKEDLVGKVKFMPKQFSIKGLAEMVKQVLEEK